MRKYETTVIIDPSLEQVKIDTMVKKYEDMILAAGTITAVEKWGKKRLAYTIKKKPTGYYVHYQYSAAPEVPEKLERDFLLNASVMRFLTVVVEKNAEKQAEKELVKQRERAAEKAAE